MSTQIVTQDKSLALAPEIQTFQSKALGAIQTLYRGREAELLIAAQTIFNSPQLSGCSAESKIMAFTKAAATGLNFNPQFGEIYFSAFGPDCTLIIGYKGLQKLSEQNGLKIVRVDVVYESEKGFEWKETETGIKMTRPFSLDGQRGGVVAAYVLAVWLDSGVVTGKILNAEQLEAKRNMSRAKNSPFWTDPEKRKGMQMKSVIRDIIARFPMSPQLAAALNNDYDNEERQLRQPETPSAAPALNASNRADDFVEAEYVIDSTTPGALYEQILDALSDDEDRADAFVAWFEAAPRPLPALRLYGSLADDADALKAFVDWSLLRKLPDAAYELYALMLRSPQRFPKFYEWVTSNEISDADYLSKLNIERNRK